MPKLKITSCSIVQTVFKSTARLLESYFKAVRNNFNLAG